MSSDSFRNNVTTIIDCTKCGAQQVRVKGQNWLPIMQMMVNGPSIQQTACPTCIKQIQRDNEVVSKERERIEAARAAKRLEEKLRKEKELEGQGNPPLADIHAMAQQMLAQQQVNVPRPSKTATEVPQGYGLAASSPEMGYAFHQLQTILDNQQTIMIELQQLGALVARLAGPPQLTPSAPYQSPFGGQQLPPWQPVYTQQAMRMPYSY